MSIALSGPNKLLFHPPFLHHQPGSRRFDELRTPGRSDSARLTGRRLLRLYRAGGW
jgi:hypothetical protein